MSIHPAWLSAAIPLARFSAQAVQQVGRSSSELFSLFDSHEHPSSPTPPRSTAVAPSKSESQSSSLTDWNDRLHAWMKRLQEALGPELSTGSEVVLEIDGQGEPVIHADEPQASEQTKQWLERHPQAVQELQQIHRGLRHPGGEPLDAIPISQRDSRRSHLQLSIKPQAVDWKWGGE